MEFETQIRLWRLAYKQKQEEFAQLDISIIQDEIFVLLLQEELDDLLIEDGAVRGVKTQMGHEIKSKAVIVS